MDRVEVTLADGKSIFSFDGRVFEYFGGFGLGGGYKVNAYRIHVRQLTVEVDGPDRKGRYTATFSGLAGFAVEYPCDDAAELAQLQPLIDALRGAGATFTS